MIEPTDYKKRTPKPRKKKAVPTTVTVKVLKGVAWAGIGATGGMVIELERKQAEELIQSGHVEIYESAK